MEAWQATVQDEAGNAVFNPQITVYESDGVTIASIYNEDGSPKDNPFTGTIEGFAQFWAGPGVYKIRGVNGGQTELWESDLGGLGVAESAKLPPYTPFESRAQAEGSDIPEDVQYITVDGLQFVRDTDGTALTTGGGITWSPVGDIQAAHFGFDAVNGGANQNRDAILAAVMWAEGRRVYIDTHGSDFTASRVFISGTPADIEVIGGGRWVITTSGALTFTGGTSLIRTVSSIDTTTLVVQGSPNTVTRLTVTDSDGYAKGDVVKICSDEIDPWDNRGNRNLGEWATVVDVDTQLGYIYLAGVLEDVYDVSENCRVALLSKNSFRFDGDIQSDINNTATAIQVDGAYRPHVRLDIKTHGNIAVNCVGSYMGDYYLSGDGKGDSEGSLGYLMNDSAGFTNTIHSPRGSYWRHVTTTNAVANAPNSDRIHAYGPTRNHTVIGGVATSPQGPAWDDHSGARRTRWIDCAVHGTLRSSSSHPCSYQLRGRDTTIVNPHMSVLSQTIGTPESMIRVTDAASGSITVINPRLDGQTLNQGLFRMPDNPNYGNVTVVVQGGVVQADNCQVVLDVRNVNLTFVGTLFVHRNVSRDNTQVFDVSQAQLVLSGVNIVTSGDGASARIARLNEGGAIAGDLALRRGGLSFARSVESTHASAEADVSCVVLDAGGTAFGGSGDFASWSVDVRFLADPASRSGRVRAPIFTAEQYPVRVIDMPTSGAGLPTGSLYRDGSTVMIT